MPSPTRETIERRIRVVSQQLENELLLQMKSNQVKRINPALLAEMISEWTKLAHYYEQSCYGAKSRDEADLEMSLFIVLNYQVWSHNLQTFMASASQSGNLEEAEELDDALNMLEGMMDNILKVTRDWDDLD